MKVAAYQTPLLPGGSTESLALIAQQVEVCEAAGVRILCCPEAVLGGLADYCSRPFDIAIDVASDRLRSILQPIASDTVTTIVGFTELGPSGQLFNSAAVFSKGEVLGIYRKLHPAINRSVYEPGRATPVFKVDDLIFGVVICRDSTYPEPARIMAENGASLLFVPTNNALNPSKGGIEVVAHARNTDVCRARENAVAVVRADVAGRIDGFASYGSSAIVDRNGSVLVSATQLQAELLVAEIEVHSVAEARCSRGASKRMMKMPVKRARDCWT